MASTYSASKYSSTVPVKTMLSMNSISSYYSVGTVADGDVINIATLPIGAQVHKVMVFVDKSIADTGGTIKVGYYTSASDEDDDAYIVSTAVTAAVVTRTSATAGLTKTFTASTRIIATLGGSATFGTDVLCTFVIFYTMNP